MTLRRLVISAALLAAFGAFVSHAPTEVPGAATSAIEPMRFAAPLR